MTNIGFWFGTAHGNQHGTNKRCIITENDQHVAEYEVYAKDTMVSVSYKGRKKATQIGGSDWQAIAQMLLRELTGELKAPA